MTLRERDFVLAARTAGVSRGRILVRHIMPHVMPSVIVFCTLGVATAIQLEAALSYVGLGIHPPTPSWGNMIADGQSYMTTDVWLVLLPGLAIMFAMLGFSLVGDGLRDALDPTLERSVQVHARGDRMIRYIAGRLGWAIVVVFAMTIITFGVTFLSPVDPARLYAGIRATHAAVRAGTPHARTRPTDLRAIRPLPRTAAARQPRHSFSTGESVRTLVLGRLPATLELAAAGLLIEVVDRASARVPGRHEVARARGSCVLTGSLLGVVVPQFVLGFVLLYLFAYKIPIFPLGATASLPALVLPALALGLPGAAWYARMVRSSVLNVLGEDFVRNSRAKGLSEWSVMGAPRAPQLDRSGDHDDRPRLRDLPRRRPGGRAGVRLARESDSRPGTRSAPMTSPSFSAP